MNGAFSFKRNVADEVALDEKRKDGELKKTRKMIRGLHRPVLPVYCRFFFWCMLIAPLLNFIMELVSYIPMAGWQPFGAFLMKISWSMLMIWAFFAVFLTVFSVIQYVKAVKYGYEDRIYRFKDEVLKTESFSAYEVVARPEEHMGDVERLTLYAKKACPDTRKKYLRYIVTAVGGTAALALFYVLCLVFVK